ncbi:O-antigen ligase family protein [Bowmanella sp. Y26]|uniref:O-antigen ligase family protein n=1 Tax=Bowmanella yangjiangensis TaxID=2811230 RepID=UPI001BDCB448|nr:O-antigen ligase family protein [Bowmanella yangjiangensis]MBT1065574.1 O-antigen ligase family protein [Bowmanella yangjiangensis]
MRLQLDSMKRCCLLLALLYYCGVLDFTTRLTSGRADDMMASHAAGDPARQIMGVLLLLLVALLLWHSRNVKQWRLSGDFVWWCLLGYLALSVLWSYAPSVSLRRVVAFSTLVLTAYVLVQSFTLMSLLRFFARTVGLLTLLGLLLVPLIPEQVMVGGGLRANAFVGLFADKNAGARNCAYALLLFAGSGLHLTTLDKFLMLILTIGIVLADSATAWVMLIGGLGLIMALRYLHSHDPATCRHRLLLFGSLLAGGTLLGYALYADLLTLLGRDPTLTNRVVIWELLAQYIETEPYFGFGFGAFWVSDAALSFVTRWGYIGNAHSGYYEAMLHGGLLCLLLVSGVMLASLWQAGKAYCRSPQGQHVAAMLAILLLMIPINAVAFAVLNHNSFDMFLFALISFSASRLAAETKHNNRRVP